jgi:hypothetical protein
VSKSTFERSLAQCRESEPSYKLKKDKKNRLDGPFPPVNHRGFWRETRPKCE